MEYKINYTINGILEADNLPDVERERLRELINIYEFHAAKNELKDKYYEGHIPLKSVNLGIALPKNLRNFEIGCEWGLNVSMCLHRVPCLMDSYR